MAPDNMSLVPFSDDSEPPVIEVYPELDEVMKEKSGDPDSGVDQAFTCLDVHYNRLGYEVRDLEKELTNLTKEIQRRKIRRDQISRIMGDLEKLGAKKILSSR